MTDLFGKGSAIIMLALSARNATWLPQQNQQNHRFASRGALALVPACLLKDANTTIVWSVTPAPNLLPAPVVVQIGAVLAGPRDATGHSARMRVLKNAQTR